MSYAFRSLTKRFAAIAAAILVLELLSSAAVVAQERTLCIAGAPTVYVDSSTSGVVVLTTEGKRFDAERNLLLCPGDEIRTGLTGRVSIRFEDKRTVIRLDGNSRTRILRGALDRRKLQLIQTALTSSGGAGSPDMSLLSGILYFVSSVRRQFQVDTPYIVAGIEGTEALVAVQPRDQLAIAAVREGVITAFDHAIGRKRSIRVPAGEAAFRSASVPFQSAPIWALRPPFRDLLVVSNSAVDWAIYYPPILLAKDVRSRQVREAIVLLSSGDYELASARLDAAGSADRASVAALRTIIAVSRNHIAEAKKWSKEALQADPRFAPAHIAASYVHQATGDLEGAISFARDAVSLAPANAYAAARLAELYMVVGDRRKALSTANTSLNIKRTPLALFVAGLAQLAAWKYEVSEAYFEEAIALDSEAPLPRLGLGLTYVRQGKIAAGTWEFERAVALDPKRASLRNWLGRGYFAEHLPGKAADQFKMAKEQDPEDPTSYLFSALERFSANQPITALHDLQEAERHGDARQVIRSEAGLNEDTATRGAAMGRIYDVLSFDQQAINAGTEAVETAPANPGAHRFLADAYRTRPGYEFAQTSELLLSQILSPPSSTPVQPSLAEADLALLDTTGPSRVTFAEFAPLFDSDGVHFYASGLAGTQNTWGDEVSITGLSRNASLSVGQMHYETDGFHSNNDIKHDIFNAVTTIAINPEFSLFGEFLDRKTEGGDRRLNFEIEQFDSTARSQFERQVARLGFHYQPSIENDLIGVYTWAKASFRDTVNDGDEDIIGKGTERSNTAQLQNIWQGDNLRNITGASLSANDRKSTLQFGPTDPVPDAFETSYWSAYSYFYLEAPQRLTWTLGASAVKYKQDGPAGFEETKLLPKLGVKAEISEHVTLRASYLRNLKPDLISDQILEPTSVAGFNQQYDFFNGALLEQVGGAIDIRVNDNLMVGVEAIKRWWTVPLSGIGEGETTEQVYRGYVNVLLSENIALAAAIVREQSHSNISGDFPNWQTTAVPVTLSYFSESGWFASAGIEFVDHSFSFNSFGSGGNDTFAPVNATLGYRMPDNRGIVSLEVQNLLDETIHFQSRTIQPALTSAPRYAPELTVLARATFNF